MWNVLDKNGNLVKRFDDKAVAQGWIATGSAPLGCKLQEAGKPVAARTKDNPWGEREYAHYGPGSLDEED